MHGIGIASPASSSRGDGSMDVLIEELSFTSFSKE